MVSISGTRSEKPLLNDSRDLIRSLVRSAGFRPCRGFPSHSILDFARDDRSAKRNRPIRNFNFTGAQKLPRFDDRDTALGKPNKVEEHLVGFERQWDHSLGWLNMVGKPNRRSYAGGCLLPGFLRQDRSAIAVLSKHYAARQARHARADNCDSLRSHQMVGMRDRKNTRSGEHEIAV